MGGIITKVENDPSDVEGTSPCTRAAGNVVSKDSPMLMLMLWCLKGLVEKTRTSV